MRLTPRPVRVYDLLTEAVSVGVTVGYRRAHKHSDNPPEEYVKEQIERAVTEELCERFEMGDGNESG